MSDNYISWTNFCQAMNSIAYWLVQNQKKYKKRDHYQILTLKGTVKAIGNGTKDEAMVVKVGDTVLYGKYSGTELEFDGVKYLMMRQSDILAIIEK